MASELATNLLKPLISISPDLSLRVLRPYEAETLYMLVHSNREHLRRWLPWLDSTRSPSDTRKSLEANYAGFLKHDGFNFGIRHKGSLVGTVGFHGFDRVNRVTSLGYWLAEDACGQGIMRQSVEACMRFAFLDQQMNRIYIRCATGNESSKRIPKSLGYTYEGTQREAEWLYDHFVDLEVYSMLVTEWRNSVLV